MPTIPEALAQALQHHQAGNLNQAEQLYRAILQADPRHADSLHLLGVLASQVGQHEWGVSYIQQALQVKPNTAVYHSNLGYSYQALGRLEDAVWHYREALRLQPDYADAHANMGNALHALGKFDEAIHSLEQSLKLRPDLAGAHNTLGVVHKDLGHLEEAEASFRQALRSQPAFADACNNLGAVLHAQGKPEEAAACYRQAIAQSPGFAEAYNNLGQVLFEQKKLDEAVASFREAIRIKPDNALTHHNLGFALQDQGKLAEAELSYRQALRFDPNNAELHNKLGNVLADQQKRDSAAICYREAIRLNPDYAAAHNNLASMLISQAYMEEAEKHFKEGLRLQPSNSLRCKVAILLPPIYQSTEELLDWRQRLTKNVAQLHEEGVKLDLTHEKGHSPFFLVYQGFNDRDLHRQVAGLYTAPTGPANTARARREGHCGKLRIGFVSRCFTTHTIGRLMRGLIAKLSREAFHVTVLSVGEHKDEIGRWIAAKGDDYVVLPFNLPTAREVILRQRLDVLFYTDIGMDPVTYSLAFTRLAPVQCVTWGHGVTTGIPTIDYFISSEELESSESHEHYTENLVRLKVPAIYYYRPRPPARPAGRSAFGLPESGTVYASPQSLFKFHPDFDAILGGILRGDPSGTLVLVRGRHPRWDELLLQRFRTSMPDVANRIRFVPHQDYEQFLNLNTLVDVLLDPIHFGGGNTSYEGLALGIPIVTLPTEILRGRITWMLYAQMGVFDCVVQNPEQYVERTVKLGKDRACRAAISAKIKATSDVLFENDAGVRELETFLQDAVNRAAFTEPEA